MKAPTIIAYILLLLTLGMLLERGIRELSGQTYKGGQIDYANGIIKYKLVKQINGTTQWECVK